MATPTPEQVLQMVQLLSDKIVARRPDIQTNVQYFKGTEGRMKFASEEFREYFQRRFEGFSDNWCMPVGQAPVERMRYLGMVLPGSHVADSRVAQWWERNDADRGLSEALQMMTIAKRSFGLVSPTPQGARITFEHPDSAAVIYDPVTRKRRAGLTIWQDEKWEYGEFHLPASTLKVKRKKATLDRGEYHVPPDVTDWQFDDDSGAVEVKNPLGEVALVEFLNQMLLDNDPISDIAGVRAMQDTINLIWAYLLNILDYASLPGRAILGGEKLEIPELDEQGQITGYRPLDLDALIRDRMIHIPGSKGDAKNPSIDEWTAADPGPLSQVIENAIKHVASQTRTPGHYLLAGSNVPASGYQLAESGLASKAAERISYAMSPLREINRLAALAEDLPDLAGRIALGHAKFRKPQFRDEAQLMDGLVKMRQTGFPLRFIVEEYGLSPEDVDRVMDMVREEQEQGVAADLSFLNGPTDAAATTAQGD